jgi:hypothetical protein
MRVRPDSGSTVPAVLLIAAVALVLSGAVHGSDAYPILPEDGALSTGRVQFRIGYDGGDLLDTKFRIVLTPEAEDAEELVLDQVEEPSTWAYVHDQDIDDGAICHLRKPLAHGVYVWRVDVWTGVDWIEGNDESTLYVDTVPPADVDGLRMEFDAARGEIVLSWDPVSTDQEGGPEYVARYHVYRYTKPPLFLIARPFRVGETDTTVFTDPDQNVVEYPILFYTIIAEDEAGNTVDRMHRSREVANRAP